MVRKLVVLMFVVSLLFCTASLAKAEPIKIKVANYWPPVHMASITMGKMCDELNKRLAGKAEVTYYPGGVLLTGPKMAAGVAAGTADIGISMGAYTRGRFPVMEALELPWGIPSSYVGTHVFNEFMNKVKPKEWEGYHVLFFGTNTPNVVQTVSKQVKTLDDIKGLKIRATGRAGDIVKALGAAPVPMEAVDTYDALRRGVIDGVYIPYEAMKGWRFGEVEKYHADMAKVGSVYTFYVVMNKHKWDSLPPDVQKIINDVAAEYMEGWCVAWNKMDIDGKEYFLKVGGTVTKISDSEIAKMHTALLPIFDLYKKDMVSKGFKAADIDGWMSFIKERVDYWKKQEKAHNIPTAYPQQ